MVAGLVLSAKGQRLGTQGDDETKNIGEQREKQKAKDKSYKTPKCENSQTTIRRFPEWTAPYAGFSKNA